MEKCQSDQMAYIKGAAYEASQTAKTIAREIGSKCENGNGSVTRSNFSGRGHSRRRNLVHTGDQSPANTSPESQMLDSFMEHDSLPESPVSMTQISRDMEYDQRSVNRELWRYENGGIDVSSKDGLFSAVTRRSSVSGSPSDHQVLSNHGSEYLDELQFLHGSPRNGLPRSTTPSPQRSRSRIDIGNLVTTPRKLICSLQDPIEFNSDYSEKQPRRFRSPCLEKFQWSPKSNYNHCHRGMIYKVKGNGYVHTEGEQFHGVSEPISSTDETPAADVDLQGFHEAVPANKTETREFRHEKAPKKTGFKMFFGLFSIIVAVLITSLVWAEVHDESFYDVPT